MSTSAVNSIRLLVQGHAPADARESDSKSRILNLLETADAPFSRHHYVPGHLTASAIVLDPQRQSTLLILHSKLKLWLQPGGHFEPGETDPSHASAREVLEETGLRGSWPGPAPILLDVDVHEIPARKAEPAHFHFDLRMLLIAEKREVQAGDEGVSEARWFKPAEFKALTLDPGLARALKKVGLEG